LRYCRVTWDDYTHESAGWVGQVKRPIAIAMTRVEYTFQAILEYGNPELSGGWLDNLAQYVITDPAPYQMWRDRVIERLEALYPWSADDKLGEVVPREALDPDFDFRLEQTESLINRFLATLDYRSNPFLNSPDKILEQGFEGTPYIFDIERDRQSRVEERGRQHS
jgi:hypothetical protein